MPDPIPGQLTAFLEDTEKRYRVFGESDAMPRLLAAIESGQKLIAGWKAKAAQLDAAADRVPDGQPGGILKFARAQAYEDCARELREALTAALLGGSEDA